MSERVLLVGARSPLGRSIGAELDALGHSVVYTSRDGGHGLEVLDVTDASTVSGVLERARPTVVIYLARPGPGNSPDAIERTAEDLTAFATRCSAVGVERILFASSASVYGTDGVVPACEGDRAEATSPNALLKLASEAALTDVARAGGTRAIVFRIFNIYGPGFTNSLVNRLAAGDGSSPVVYTTDRFVRDYIHVSDVARGFASGLVAPIAGTEIVNLGTGIATDNRALLELCPGAVYVSDPDPTVRSFSVANIERARSYLGFEPRVRLESAIRSPDEFLRGPAPASGN